MPGYYLCSADGMVALYAKLLLFGMMQRLADGLIACLCWSVVAVEIRRWKIKGGM